MKASNTKPPDDNRKDQWRAIARYSGLGVEMTAAVLGMAFLGQYIDKRLGNEQPLFTILLSFIGVIYVFYRIFRISSE